MKKLLLTILTFVTASVSADTCRGEWESSQYFTIGTGPILLIPNIGIGYRWHEGCNGFDLSLNYSTVFVAHQVQGVASYQFYPRPYAENPLYFGVGIAGGNVFTNDYGNTWTLAPDVSIGKVLLQCDGSKHFVEAHVQGPTWATSNNHFHHKSRLDFPLMYVKYGIGF